MDEEEGVEEKRVHHLLTVYTYIGRGTFSLDVIFHLRLVRFATAA